MSNEPMLWIDYPDYQRATRHLSLEQRGLLLQLHLLKFGPHGLPADPEDMRCQLFCPEDVWRRDWPIVRKLVADHPWLRVSDEMPEDEV